MKLIKYTTLALLPLAMSVQATAVEGDYLSIYGGLTQAAKSNNMGAFDATFTTGAGTTIPAGVDLAAGTPLAWNTKYDMGWSGGLAYGLNYGNGLRAEIELKYMRNAIQGHSRVTVGDILLNGEDAGVLITGSGNLGVNVLDLVSAGEGNSSTMALMGNVFYDFMSDQDFSPYVGVGLGYAHVSNTFSPSGVGIADDKSSNFAYQGIVGASYNLSDTMAVYSDYRYFSAGNITTQLDLLPATLEVENKVHQFNIGLRFNF